MKLFKVLLVVIVALISVTSAAAFKDGKLLSPCYTFTFLLLILHSVRYLLAICALPGGANGDGKIACLASIPSWSYRAGTNECVQFMYGGCGGNENRFSTQHECENKCKE